MGDVTERTNFSDWLCFITGDDGQMKVLTCPSNVEQNNMNIAAYSDATAIVFDNNDISSSLFPLRWF